MERAHWFLECLQNNPVLIKAVVVALCNLFALSQADAEAWATAVSVVLPLVAGFVVRQLVAGPKTARELAEGLERARIGLTPTPEQLAAVKKVQRNL